MSTFLDGLKENAVCPDCHGTGMIETDVWNEDAHAYEKGTGSMKCHCQIRLNDEPYDDR